MIVFLEKVRVKTIFSIIDPVKVEPLELCYLKSVLNNMNIDSYIVDRMFGFNPPKDVTPDIIVLTGYNTAENEIIIRSETYKKKYPEAKIIAGGVHVQENAEYFRVNTIDYIFHSVSLNTFKILIEKINNNDKIPLNYGVDSRNKDGWHLGEKESIYEYENIKPDRDFFYAVKSKLKYLDKRNVALIKSSVGCPYRCSFCYCKLLNNKRFIAADYEKMIEEMETIDADYYWVVDDVLFSTRDEALKFIEIAEKRKSNLNIIGYLRADFICREKDLLRKLRNAGIREVITGFEATINQELKDYNKTTDAADYPLAISLLKENHIELTALFMVKPGYGLKDFNILREFIKANKIDVYTISIMTPIKKTKLYEELEELLIDKRPERYDFLHLVLKPKLPKLIFYALFYGLHIRLLRSKRIRKFLLDMDR
ncbi:MAG: hypothetical protein GX289_01420 [Tissierellia bacterium]|nr:hypothetical protein [Tissierellia bacterium]